MLHLLLIDLETLIIGCESVCRLLLVQKSILHYGRSPRRELLRELDEHCQHAEVGTKDGHGLPAKQVIGDDRVSFIRYGALFFRECKALEGKGGRVED